MTMTMMILLNAANSIIEWVLLLTLITVVYYMVLFLAYSNKVKTTLTNAFSKQINEQFIGKSIAPDIRLSDTMHALTNEVTAYLEQSASDHTERQLIVLSLAKIIEKYNWPNEKLTRLSILSYINIEVQTTMRFNLTDDELNMVWPNENNPFSATSKVNNNDV